VEQAALLKAQKLLHLFAYNDTSDPPLHGGGESEVMWGLPSSSQLPLEQPLVVAPDIGASHFHGWS